MLLEGIRVIELASVISGPFAGLTLADHGAEVIKVEVPGKGDAFRGWQDTENEISPAFFAMNRGKKSITLNLKEHQGKVILLRLLEHADVLIENFRPGVMTRLGLDYESLKSVNPGLIYCSITGMGQSGPEQNRPVFDAIAQAYSGLWSQLTDLSDPEPVGPPLADQLSGQQAASAILAALVKRGSSGEGCRLDTSMIGASLAFQPLAIASYAMEGRVADKLSRAFNSQSFAFVDSNGKPFAVHLSSPTKFWERLIEAIDRPDLVRDLRFAQRSGRVVNYHALRNELQKTFGSGSREHWVDRLQSCEVPVSPIHTIDEALNTDQVRALNLVDSVDQAGKAVTYVSTAASVNGDVVEPPAITPAPLLGEHTESVLIELGIKPSELRQLITAGVL